MDAYLQIGVNRMDWSACGPDLNPGEHIWDELDCCVRNNHIPPTDSQNLFQILQAEWQALPKWHFTAFGNAMRSH